ncbi:hypothetical protein RUM44_001126 [Polyplax serrata]|uniref:Uncharacterized protein n=1 Tax=Polyplax serrata TaxID=468196 RepID=A0ABR1B6P1_POLSC
MLRLGGFICANTIVPTRRRKQFDKRMMKVTKTDVNDGLINERKGRKEGRKEKKKRTEKEKDQLKGSKAIRQADRQKGSSEGHSRGFVVSFIELMFVEESSVIAR